ncbi:MAG: aminotransferase class I/II-fold pyridoxal phosphate-dependent enzyme [Bacteroidales bacterium]|nr:aminotransferase class I/II-fold pyridoxal phosphate-dependent enzyme [Bacteroidales bacterium]
MVVEPAQRIAKVEEYYFSKKRSEIAELEKKGADIIHLGIGCPDLQPLPEVHKSISEALYKPFSNAYQGYRGLPELREAFANWYKRIYHVEVNPASEILPLMGSKEGILLIHMAFVNPGDTVLIPDPGYPAYTAAAKLVGANIKYYNLKEENDWQPDFNELESLIDDKTKVMWTTYPGMPTAQQAKPGLFEKLISLARKKKFILVNDNPYSLILTQKANSLLQNPDALDVCVELNSLSKASNLPGMRMGAAFANKDVIDCILRVKSNYDNGMYKPIMEGAITALNAGDDWYKSINETYERRRKIGFAFLDKLGCKNYNHDTAGLFLWARVPERFKDGNECADYLLYEKSIFLTPGFIFGKNGDQYIRLSLCSPEDLMTKALNRLD